MYLSNKSFKIKLLPDIQSAVHFTRKEFYNYLYHRFYLILYFKAFKRIVYYEVLLPCGSNPIPELYGIVPGHYGQLPVPDS